MRLEEMLEKWPPKEEVFEPKKGDKWPAYTAEVSRDPSGKIIYIKPGFGKFLEKK